MHFVTRMWHFVFVFVFSLFCAPAQKRNKFLAFVRELLCFSKELVKELVKLFNSLSSNQHLALAPQGSFGHRIANLLADQLCTKKSFCSLVSRMSPSEIEPDKISFSSPHKQKHMPPLNRRHLPTAMTNKKPTISASTCGELWVLLTR